MREFTPRFTSDLCGIDEAALIEAARWFAKGPTLSLYCQGLNQSTSGTAKNAADSERLQSLAEILQRPAK